MKPIEEFVVPWVRTAESYSDAHLEYAWQHPETTRLMSNENPLPPAEAVIDAVVETARQANLYPDTGPELRRQLGASAGLGAENVILGNGSTEVLEMIIRTFVSPGDEAIIPVPTFSMYEARVRVSGGMPVLVPLTSDFYWDVDALLAARSEKTKLLIVCTPNNPIGNEIREADLRRLLALGVPTVVDEAYFELQAEARTWARLLPEYPNMIVSRTFSKAYGLAGMRLGFALANEVVIQHLGRTRIPWNVNLITLAAAQAAVADPASLAERQQLIQHERAYLREQIDRLPGLRSFPSEGNFVLIDASALGRTSKAIVEALLARGVFVRPMAVHHLGEGFVRVTVGTPAQNEQFVRALRGYAREVLRPEGDPAETVPQRP